MTFIIENLTVEDVMTDEGYQRMSSLVEWSHKVIENMAVCFDEGGCMRLECQVAECCKSADEVEDVLQGLVDILCRELVYGWDLIVDASVSVYGARSRHNLVKADLCYERDKRLVRVGVMKYGAARGVVYEYEV
jgi:hypothetical protein